MLTVEEIVTSERRSCVLELELERLLEDKYCSRAGSSHYVRVCKRISSIKRELNKLYKIGSGLSDGYYECVFDDQSNRLSLGNGNYVVIIPRIDY